MQTLVTKLAVLAVLAGCVMAQQGPQAAPSPANAPAPATSDGIRPTYVLGAGDQIVIRAAEAEDLSDKPFRVATDGSLTLPMVGRVPAAGVTVQQLESDLVERLKVFIRTPQVSIAVVQFRSEPVFFVGAFRAPGIYLLLGQRTLVDMLASIGGLQPNASRRIKVTRRNDIGKIPLENVVEDPAGKVSSVEIGLGSLRDNVNPQEDIELMPFDVISVERAELVYVNGEIGKVGAFELGERDSISVVQVLSLAGGLTRQADSRHARILRPVGGTARRAEIPLDLDKILKGEANDYPLRPNDLLYIPRNPRATRLLGQLGVTGLSMSTALATTLIYILLR